MREENTCSFFIRNIAHTVKCMQDKCLLHYGLSNQQARLLGEIIRLSKKNKVFGRRDFAQALNLKGPSVTSLLHGLENKGLIETQASGKDGRRKIFSPTDEGKKLIKQMDLVFEATENQLVDRLTDEEIERFKEYLQIAYENMNE